MTRTAIALIAKTPRPGRVKTRCCPPLSEAQAVALAEALLRDTAARAAATGAEVWCVHDGPAPPLRRLLGDAVRLRPQRGTGLAERLAACQEDLFARGYARVVLLGADCPTVDTGLLGTALELLEGCDAVIGPASDGGYTLLGTRRPTPELLCGVAMGTEAVLRQTLERAAAAGVDLRCVEERHDLDELDDLVAARDSGQLDGALHTLALLPTLVLR